MKNATHRFSEENLKQIAFLAKKNKVSRSATVRRAVEELYQAKVVAPIINGRSPKKCP